MQKVIVEEKEEEDEETCINAIEYYFVISPPIQQ